MALKSLSDLLQEQVEDLYNAEHQILDALPKMAEAASSPELKKAFDEHRDLTQAQEHRLKKVFEQLGSSPHEKHCKGMEGLLKEGEEILQEEADAPVRDAALIGAAQKVEHYEISAYGTARTFAETLGKKEVADLLQQTLKEEEATDAKLSQIAENTINPKAKL